jgi:deoxyribose-phosphate aldolase
MEPYRILLSCIDLTSLEGRDNKRSINELCHKAFSFGESGLPLPAAVCIYPPFIGLAKDLLKGTGIRVATVAGAFPSGQTTLSVKLDEARYCINQGADEIDIVISRGRLLEGDEMYVFNEIAAIREVCKDVVLKVILETGELRNPDFIRNASEIAITAGADFLKTSTGKTQPAATEYAVEIMLLVIREQYIKTGKKTGIKPSGGISEPTQALRYFQITERIMGAEWKNKGLFRIGASHLADALAREIVSFNPI